MRAVFSHLIPLEREKWVRLVGCLDGCGVCKAQMLQTFSVSLSESLLLLPPPPAGSHPLRRRSTGSCWASGSTTGSCCTTACARTLSTPSAAWRRGRSAPVSSSSSSFLLSSTLSPPSSSSIPLFFFPLLWFLHINPLPLVPSLLSHAPHSAISSCGCFSSAAGLFLLLLLNQFRRGSHTPLLVPPENINILFGLLRADVIVLEFSSLVFWCPLLQLPTAFAT